MLRDHESINQPESYDITESIGTDYQRIQCLQENLTFIYAAFRISYSYTKYSIEKQSRDEGIEQQLFFARLYIRTLRELDLIGKETGKFNVGGGLYAVSRSRCTHLGR